MDNLDKDVDWIEVGKMERLTLREKDPDAYWKKYPHGEVVEVQQLAFHDVTIYEDGHEESFYIGD